MSALSQQHDRGITARPRAGHKRFAIRLAAALTAMAFGGTSGQAAANLSGIWSPDQGVLWAQSARGGPKEAPPFTPEYKILYQEALDAAAAGHPKADPPARCLPPGVPRIMASPFPFELIQDANAVYFLHEYMSQIRRVFLAHAPDRIGLPTYNGYSVGHWDGDALVIETRDLMADSVLDTTHLPHSKELRVVEKLQLLSADKLQDEITLIDPKAYTKPWTVVRTYTRKPGEQILEYICEENNRNPVGEDGTTGFVGPK